MKMIIAKKEHEVAYADLLALIRKHADKITAEELLAIAANMLGKLIAYQDQRTMTHERAIKTILSNIERGNQQAINELRTKSEGTG